MKVTYWLFFRATRLLRWVDALLFNVHGKAQFKIGTFKDWVEALTVYHPSKGEVPCSATENPEAV
jgi:hypothetical protein